jgi:hypothetical protein
VSDSEGTLIRGADGELYFIRDEILQACKVTEADMKEFCEGLVGDEGEVQGFALSTGPISKAVIARGPFQSAGGINKGGLGAAESTIMCPGVMKDGAFQINPADKFAR